MTDSSKPVWAGFWRRSTAYVVDAVLLAAAGLAVGSLLFDQLAALPGPTRLISLPVGLLYFGVLSSRLGGSATLGMRLLGLRVLTLRGRPIGLLRSLWRALWLQLPFTLNGTYLSLDRPELADAYMLLALTCVFGVVVAQVILLLFNRPSRRLVHDLLSGTAVVRTGTQVVPLARSRAPVVAFAWIALVAAAAGAARYGGALGLTLPWEAPALATNQALLPPQQAVLALPEVQEAVLQDATTTVWAAGDGTKTTTRTLVVTARLKTWPADEDREVARVAEAALAVYSLAPGQQMRVNLRYGYDLGFAGGWRGYSADYAPPPPAPAKSAPPQPAAPAPAAPEPAPAAAPTQG